MKKLVVTMCLLAACMFVGCGSDNEKVIDGNNNSQVESEKDNTEGKKGYVFESNNTEVIIDAEAAPIFAGLGKEESYFESPSCAFGDLDKIYTYPGFEVDTYSLEGVDYVSAIILLDDSVATPEGICIGETAAKVKEVYGEPTSETATMLAYVKDHMKLCFIIKDDAVEAIEYRTMILEQFVKNAQPINSK